MKLKYADTIVEQQESAAKVPSIAYSPNGRRLAVATSDRAILLFDENHRRRDKFPTKPIDSKYGKKSYVVRQVVFSPDSMKLAVGQSDSIVFVYRLGDSWEEKKVICNKFGQSAAVGVAAWPLENALLVGLVDGKVRLASCASNKCSTLYKTDSMVVSLSVAPDRKSFLSGHGDGSVFLFSFVSKTQTKVAVHPCAPYSLVLTANGILAGGCDRRILSYSAQGRMLQQFDYGAEDDEKEFTVAVGDPPGQNVVFGSFDRLRLFQWNQRRGAWDEGNVLNFKYLYAVSALAWRPDGSAVVCGSLCGSVLNIDCSLKRSLIKNQFETIFVAPSQVNVTDTATGRKVDLRSKKNLPVQDIKVMGRTNGYIVAYTSATLILADIENNKASEIAFQSVGSERFYFDSANVCIIVNAGEVTLVEYGIDVPLGFIRTELISPHLISVRLNERKTRRLDDVKKVAYLLDVNTISVVDLARGQHQVAQIVHSAVIDWLELNETATKLLFRDRKSRLTLFDLRDERRSNLLNFCTYVQWVPSSDVVVAQSEHNLCVWYNTDDPEQVTSVPIAGDVEMVLRDAQLTEVIVMEGNARNAYQLDAKLIEFGTAIEDLDFPRAVSFLEHPERSGDADSMWKHLAQVAIEHANLIVAQRCYAALNDIARVMQKTVEIADAAGEEGVAHYRVRARLEIMKKNFKEAECIYLENNGLDEAIEMYQSLHQWEEAINLATARNHPDLEKLKAKYYRNLFDSGQDEKAAEIKEREGDLHAAIDLYLKANLAAHAARVLLQNPKLLNDDLLVENVSGVLVQSGNFERVGALYEQTKNFEKALHFYRKGANYAKAIDVARFAFPAQVVELEEEWADHLMAENSAEAAVSHYLESGKTLKAVDAAIKGREFAKAVEILEVLDDAELTAEYYAKIGEFYARNGQYEKAEKMFVDAGHPEKAILMYDQASRWTDAYRLASEFFGPEKTRDAYLQKAEQLEGQGNLKEAEELYVHIGETSRAVAMYKKAGRLDEMMALMERYHSEHVQDTHKRLAAEFEEKGDFKAAEEQYMLGSDWKSVIHMYTEAEQWEEAFRVAKSEGGDSAQRHVAYLWAKSLGGDSAVKLMQRYGLLDDSIDLACEKSDFAFAFDLARFGAATRKPEIHQKLAERLEEEGELGQAEEHYLQAGKAKEAVHMYIVNYDWDAAERVAAAHCPDALPDVFIGQARVAIEQKDFSRAESYLLRANRSDIILRYYKELGMWPEAIRIARDYVPAQLPQLQEEYEKVLLKSGARGAQSFMAQARDWEAQGEYQRAVAAYMRVQRPVTDDAELIASAWTQAGDLAAKFLMDENGAELVEEIGSQLEVLQQLHAAADLYLAANKPELAVRAFLLAKDWAKAKRVASELVPEMADNVDEAYKEFLKDQGKVGELIDVDVISAIDLFVERGLWEKALDTAKHQNYPPLLDKYVAAYATALIQEDRFLDAVRVFEKYGASANVQNFNMYKKLIDQIVNARYSSMEDQFAAMVSLRNLIFGLNERIKESESETDRRIVEIFTSYQYILHLYALRCALAPFDNAELQKIRLQISVGLLRYVDLIQPDRAFFEAGMACREAGEKYENLAFVLLDHCLDICEAIEEENPNIVDSAIFEDTDIPSQFSLPQETYLTPQEYEEVKDWVLTVSVDAKVDKVLPVDRRGCYEASTVDGRGGQFPVCVVSGYPIIDSAKELGNGVKADLANWQTFVTVSKTQPTDQLDNVQEFLARWTKKMSSLSL
ncbi:hypothetical protein QR680_017169 [Steinernema hermaphroditum]|uniref:Uncharacterized protein n=1 Tax=Steinernema hermaphroditum TaxID=289476 RepID=A0AA39HFR7_9BILA|nr:hypothetical protein QR680_017169 [Steinernema hermaphroditum]